MTHYFNLCSVQLLLYCIVSLINFFFFFCVQVKSVKNVSRDAFGTKLGRVHMKTQDFSKMQTRKLKGLKQTLAQRKTSSSHSRTTKMKWCFSLLNSCALFRCTCHYVRILISSLILFLKVFRFAYASNRKSGSGL